MLAKCYKFGNKTPVLNIEYYVIVKIYFLLKLFTNNSILSKITDPIYS